jgi:chromosome partitioning protein
MGKIIAVSNQKGGVGKTTSTLNIGAGLVQKGKKVLLLDLDPQGSLTTCMGFEPSELENTIAVVIDSFIRRSPISEIQSLIMDVDGLHLLPSNITLSVVENAIVTATSREYILKKILAPLKAQYDYILIDCLPSLGMLNLNALTACDSVLVPIKAQFLDLKGFELLLDSINLVKEETNPDIVIEGIVLTMYDERLKLAKKVSDAIDRAYGGTDLIEGAVKIFNTRISTSTKAAEASVTGKSIFEYDKSCKTAGEYERLVMEVLLIE